MSNDRTFSASSFNVYDNAACTQREVWQHGKLIFSCDAQHVMSAVSGINLHPAAAIGVWCPGQSVGTETHRTNSFVAIAE